MAKVVLSRSRLRFPVFLFFFKIQYINLSPSDGSFRWPGAFGALRSCSRSFTSISLYISGRPDGLLVLDREWIPSHGSPELVPVGYIFTRSL